MRSPLAALGVVDRRLRVENVVQPAHGGGAALEDVGHESQRDHGENQLHHEGVKRHELAERDPVSNDHLPPCQSTAQNESHPISAEARA